MQWGDGAGMERKTIICAFALSASIINIKWGAHNLEDRIADPSQTHYHSHLLLNKPSAHLFKKYLQITYCLPGPGPAPGPETNKTHHFSSHPPGLGPDESKAVKDCPQGPCSLGGEEKHTKNTQKYGLGFQRREITDYKNLKNKSEMEICIYETESLCCTPEINRTLWISYIYSNIKF